ncbi:uncharacterized protein VTP21DRAFT_3730 [Calcarisporiella thermophila]|uniref:uncharacterized protein n=1 Tax=Calcarisporiella thermophila TaxID=911321 RepID=UPI003743A4F8
MRVAWPAEIGIRRLPSVSIGLSIPSDPSTVLTEAYAFTLARPFQMLGQKVSTQRTPTLPHDLERKFHSVWLQLNPQWALSLASPVARDKWLKRRAIVEAQFSASSIPLQLMVMRPMEKMAAPSAYQSSSFPIRSSGPASASKMLLALLTAQTVSLIPESEGRLSPSTSLHRKGEGL